MSKACILTVQGNLKKTKSVAKKQKPYSVLKCCFLFVFSSSFLGVGWGGGGGRGEEEETDCSVFEK